MVYDVCLAMFLSWQKISVYGCPIIIVRSDGHLDSIDTELPATCQIRMAIITPKLAESSFCGFLRQDVSGDIKMTLRVRSVIRELKQMLKQPLFNNTWLMITSVASFTNMV